MKRPFTGCWKNNGNRPHMPRFILKEKEILMIKPKEMRQVLDRLKSEYGQTGTALKFVNPFQLLVSTMLAAQSTDKQVNKITQPLYREYPDARSFLKMRL